MKNQRFDLVANPEWEITSSGSYGPKSFPTVNLCVVGPSLGSMPFALSMSVEQAQIIIDKLSQSCEMLEIVDGNKIIDTASGSLMQ